MKFFNVVSTVVRKSLVLQGRAARSEYWYWILFIILVTVAVGVVSGGTKIMDSMNLSPEGAPLSPPTMFPSTIIITIFYLLTLIPSVTVTVRRLHDLNHSGWWVVALFASSPVLEIIASTGVIDSMIAGFINFVITVAFLILFARRGTIGDNRFGSDPLA